MGHTTVTGATVTGLTAIDIVFYILMFGFLAVFLYKLYKIFKPDNYDLPKIFMSSIIGLLSYGLLFLIFVADVVHLELAQIILFRFTTGMFIFFFIFIIIDLFIGMRRFSAAASSNDNGLMLQRSNKGLGFKY